MTGPYPVDHSCPAHRLEYLSSYEKRENKKIPGAGYLHDYANLYFDAHNAMLSKLRKRNQEICILRISPKVLDISGVIISDRNASSGYVRFDSVGTGLRSIDKDMLYSRYWTHPEDIFLEWQHKSIKCAEALVPDKVGREYIIGAYVINQEVGDYFERNKIDLQICVKSDIFF